MATKVVSITVFFYVKKLILRKENINKFRKCLLKAYTLYTF